MYKNISAILHFQLLLSQSAGWHCKQLIPSCGIMLGACRALKVWGLTEGSHQRAGLENCNPVPLPVPPRQEQTSSGGLSSIRVPALHDGIYQQSTGQNKASLKLLLIRNLTRVLSRVGNTEN